MNESDFYQKPPLILIVDDEKTLRLVLSRAMEQEGYQVSEAENGHQCLAFCQNQLPDIILLDAMMPVMDGFEATRLIRERADMARGVIDGPPAHRLKLAAEFARGE